NARSVPPAWGERDPVACPPDCVVGELCVLAPRSDRGHRQGDRAGAQDGHHYAAQQRRVVPARGQPRVAAPDDDGVYNEPYFIDKITDANGKVIYEHDKSPRRVMSVQSAREETVALQAVVTSGTATRARLPDGRPAAGKTGTTDEHGDAWFIGFTPQLTTAVWMGSPESVVPMTNVGGINVFGGT